MPARQLGNRGLNSLDGIGKRHWQIKWRQGRILALVGVGPVAPRPQKEGHRFILFFWNDQALLRRDSGPMRPMIMGASSGIASPASISSKRCKRPLLLAIWM